MRMVSTNGVPTLRDLPYSPPALFCAGRMSQYRRAAVTGVTDFFTVVAYRRRPILCGDPVHAALRAAFAKVRDCHPLRLMPGYSQKESCGTRTTPSINTLALRLITTFSTVHRPSFRAVTAPTFMLPEG